MAADGSKVVGSREVDFDAGQFVRRLVADAIKACGLKVSAVIAADPSRVAAPRAAPTTVFEVDPDPASGRADWSAGMGPTARERALLTGIAFGLDGLPSDMVRLVAGCELCRWRLVANWDCPSWLAGGERSAALLVATVDELIGRFRPPCLHWKEFKALMLAESLAHSVLTQRIWGDEVGGGPAPTPEAVRPAGGPARQPPGPDVPQEVMLTVAEAVIGHGVRPEVAAQAVRELLGMGLRPDQLTPATVAARCGPREGPARP
jgi:hypothetical protein